MERTANTIQSAGLYSPSASCFIGHCSYIAVYSCRLLSNAVMLITLNQVTKTITSIKSQYHESSKKCFMNAIIFYSDTSLGPAIG